MTEQMDAATAAIYKARWVDAFGRDGVIATDRVLALAALEAAHGDGCEWCIEYDGLMMRQGEILRAVANALNGPPGPRRSWSHHDLGEKAEALVSKQAAMIARLRAALTLLGRDDITPAGRRVLDRILDEVEAGTI